MFELLASTNARKQDCISLLPYWILPGLATGKEKSLSRCSTLSNQRQNAKVQLSFPQLQVCDRKHDRWACCSPPYCAFEQDICNSLQPGISCASLCTSGCHLHDCKCRVNCVLARHHTSHCSLAQKQLPLQSDDTITTQCPTLPNHTSSLSLPVYLCWLLPLERVKYLVVVNRYSNWPLVKRAHNGSRDLVDCLRCTFATYSMPDKCATDGGPVFKVLQNEVYITGYHQ